MKVCQGWESGSTWGSGIWDAAIYCYHCDRYLHGRKEVARGL